MTADLDHQRQAAAERMALTRERRRRGAFVVTIELKAEVVDALEDTTGLDIETSIQARAALIEHLSWFASADRPNVARNSTPSPKLVNNDSEA